MRCWGCSITRHASLQQAQRPQSRARRQLPAWTDLLDLHRQHPAQAFEMQHLLLLIPLPPGLQAPASFSHVVLLRCPS